MRKVVFRYTKDDYVFVHRMLCLRSEGYSYPKIGKMFNKDHSTVIHWCKKFHIEIGTPMLDYEEFLNDIINKKPVLNKYKYKELLEEKINRGKITYKEYLQEARNRESKNSIYHHLSLLLEKDDCSSDTMCNDYERRGD